MEFSIETFFFGLLITTGGALLVRFYKQVADNFVNGISSYDKVKLWGSGMTIFGMLYAFNIVNILVVQLIKQFFPGIS